MIFFEQWLKSRLGKTNERSKVDADALWEKVAADLPTGPLAAADPIVKVHWRGYVAGSLLLILLIGVGSYVSPSTRDAASTVVEMPPRSTSEVSLNHDATTPVHDAVTPVYSSSVRNRQERTVPSLEVVDEPSANETSWRQKNALRLTREAVPENQYDVPQLSTSEERQRTSTNPLDTTYIITTLPSTPIALLPKTTTEPPGPVTGSLSRANPHRIGLTVLAGSHVSFPAFARIDDAALTSLLSEADGPLLGYSAGVEVGYRFAPGWQLSAGVGIRGTASAFRYQTSSDTVTTVNGIVVDAIATRSVSHTNRRQVLFVPFTVIYGRAVGKFDLQLGIGSTLSLVTKQRGRTINADREIINYDTSTPEPPVKNVYVAYHLRPAVTYWATPRLGLQFRPELSYQQFGASPMWKQAGHSFDLGASFGLNFPL